MRGAHCPSISLIMNSMPLLPHGTSLIKKIRLPFKWLGFIKLPHLKPEYRNLLRAFFLGLIIALPLVWYFRLHNSQEVAAWWDDAWSYRKRIDLTNNTSSDLTDFQVSFTIDTASLITNNKLQNQCQDLRITNHQGQTIPFWIEENNPGCNNAATRIWTKVPNLPADGGAIYIYYGNSTANTSNQHDGNQVFEFFDDFNSASLDTTKWQDWVTGASNNTYTQSSGTLQITTSGCNYGLRSRNLDIADVRVRSRMIGESDAGLMTRIIDNDNLYLIRTNASSHATDYYRREGTWYGLGGGYTDFGDWSQFRIVEFITVGSTLSSTVDGQILNNLSDSTFSSGGIGLRKCGGQPTFDWVAVTKGVSSDPTTSLAAEETAPTAAGYWKFDEGTGNTAFDSAGNNDGTINGATWVSEDQCVSEKCLYFDGSSAVDTDLDVSWDDTNAVSWSFWMKPTDTSSTRKGVIGKTYSGYEWSFYQEDDELKLVYWNSGGGHTNDMDDTWGSVLNANQWTHVTYTWDGTTSKFYADGELVNSKTAADPSINQDRSNQVMIGGNIYVWGDSYFNGFLDEVRVYPYVISEDQIKQDYNRGYASLLGVKDETFMSDGLVGYWKFDESSGTTVADSSGNGDFGTASDEDVNNADTDTPPSISSGKFGNARHFDGTDDYVLTTTAQYDMVNNITVSAWVKPDSLRHQSFVATNSAGSGFQLGARSDGRLWFTTYSVLDYQTTGTYLTSGEWQLITAVMDENNDVSFYRNGEFLEKITHNEPANANTTGGIQMGRYSNGYRYDGYLDEARIYNRTLSASEVSQLYHFAPGPVGYWKFDEGSGSTANDSSGNGNTGTLENQTTWTHGKFGGAALFDGVSDYINLGDASQLKSQALTISSWVYYDSDLQTDPHGTIFSSVLPSAYELMVSDSRHLWWAKTGQWSVNYTGFYLPDKTWTHVAMTYDPMSGTKIYANGALVDSDPTIASFSYGSTDVRIGNRNDNAGFDFGGALDEVKFYDYARTPQQIVEDMNAGHPAGGSPVGSQLLYWKLNEGYGTTVHDSSGNDLSGTLGCTSACDLPSWNSQSKFNTGLQFSPSVNSVRPSVQRSPVNISSTTGSQMTWTVWIKPDTSQVGGGWIFRNGLGADENYGLNLNSPSNGKYKLSFSGNNGSSYPSVATTDYIVPASEWSHIAVIFTQDESVRFYLNGEFIEEKVWSYGPTQQATSALALGSNPGAYQNYNGEIDEFKIYSSALTADQIKLDYNAGQSTNYGVGAPAESSLLTDGSGDGPVGEWKLDENTGSTTNDTSGNSNTGTLMNSPTWSQRCHEGGCLEFSRTDTAYVDLGNPSEMDFGTGAFSVSAWFNGNETPNSTFMGIVSKGGYNDGLELRAVRASNGSYQVGGYIGTDPISAGPWTPNQWHHFTFTRDSSGNWSWYTDGVHTGSGNITTSIGTDNWEIGRMRGSLEFDGLIDHVKIYDYARTPAQVAYDYNRGKPVAHWKFDECQGSTIHDSSDNSNNGALTIGGSGTQTSAGTCSTSGAWANGASGKFSSSMSFDGTDDYVNIPGPATELQITEAITISSWIKTTKSDWQVVVDDLGSSPYSSWSQWLDPNGKIAWNDGGSWRLSNTVVNDGEWHHIVSVVDSNNILKYYIDGKLDENNYSSIDARIATSDAKAIGRRADTNSYLFSGQIDDVRIYNYALSTQQVQNVMNEGMAVRYGD